MIFPLFINSNISSGYTPSLVNYQMVSSNPLDSMNISMNQACTDSITKQMLYTAPQYNFYNFVPFGDTYNNNSYLCDPRYTLAQMAWGTPAWNNGGLFGGVNSNNNYWGFPFGGSSEANSSDKKASNDKPTDAEKRRYEKLKTFTQQLVKYEQFTNIEQKDKIEEALKNKEGTLKERYDALLNALKEVDKKTVQDFLTEGAKSLGVNDDIKGNSKSDKSFYHRLLNTGFEYNTEDLDGMIIEFYNAISELSDNDSNADHCDVIALVEEQRVDVLDVISSWNSQYNGNKKVSMIKHIANAIEDISDDEQAAKPKTYITRLATAMIKRANSLKGKVDDDVMKKLKKASDDLQEAIDEEDPNYNSVSAYFDKLYVMTRLAAVAMVEKDANSYYGEIDKDFFEDMFGTFKDKTIEDLDDEGFNAAYIKKLGIQVENKDKVSPQEEDDEVIDETDPTASTEEKEEAKAESVANSKRIVSLLCGWTSSEDAEAINEKLQKINKDNVLDLLREYYDVENPWSEGIIEKLDDDCSDHVDIKQKRKLINSILQKAEDLGLKNDDDYLLLKSLVKEHKESYKDANDFNQKWEWKWCSWNVLGSLAAGGIGLAISEALVNYNEKIDTCIKNLYKKMKEKTAQAQ